jgi:hypothetical protein
MNVSGREASAQWHMTVVFLEKGPVILAKVAKRIDQRRNW